MRKIINLNELKYEAQNEEYKIQNIIQFLQIKLLEELYYRTNIEINELYGKLEKIPGISYLMELGCKKNLKVYFYNLYIDKLFKEVIMPEKENDQLSNVIYEIRNEMLNSLILRYLPSSSFLINDINFQNRFFDECRNNNLFLCHKEDIIEFFKYRNGTNKFNYLKEVYNPVSKMLEECSEIKDDILGIIKFDEKNNIYFCDYCGYYSNFTIKIMNNKREEVLEYIPSIRKVTKEIDKLSETESDNNYNGTMKRVVELASKVENLTTIHILPDKKIHLVYSEMVKNNEHQGIELGVIEYEN